MSKYILIRANGEKLIRPVLSGLSLLQDIFLAGSPGPFNFQLLNSYCAGLGYCGKCLVRYESSAPPPVSIELAKLSPEKLSSGWRLACRHAPQEGDRIRISAETETLKNNRAPQLLETIFAPIIDVEKNADLLFGVDLGSSTLEWGFSNFAGNILWTKSIANPQGAAGADVMSRLLLASKPQGAKRLREVVLEAFELILRPFKLPVRSFCLAANPIMTSLVLGLDTTSFSKTPYGAPFQGGRYFFLAEGFPKVFIPPILGPFVGGDITAGLTWLSFIEDTPEPPYMFADLGTNGEFVLVLPKGVSLATSVPMGPALEGMGLRSGMSAAPGAITGFELEHSGLKARLYPSNILASIPKGISGSGISGTGIISLLAHLYKLGIINTEGHFVSHIASPLGQKVLSFLLWEHRDGIVKNDSPSRLKIAENVYLFKEDIEEVLKVKAAFSSAFTILLDNAGLRPADLNALVLAGSLGEHVSVLDLETLGFIPPGFGAKTKAVGNASLKGALLLAREEEAREFVFKLPDRCTSFNLAEDPLFEKKFLRKMSFEYI